MRMNRPKFIATRSFKDDLATAAETEGLLSSMQSAEESAFTKAYRKLQYKSRVTAHDKLNLVSRSIDDRPVTQDLQPHLVNKI